MILEQDDESSGSYGTDIEEPRLVNPLYGNDIYGVGTRCDPPSDHSSDDEMEYHGPLYMSVNKRKIRIAKEKKKTAKEQAAV